MATVERTIRGVTYAVDAPLLEAGIGMFEMARDGAGRFSGRMGTVAFRSLTREIGLRLVPTDPGGNTVSRARFLKVLRSVLGARSQGGRKEKSQTCQRLPLFP